MRAVGYLDVWGDDTSVGEGREAVRYRDISASIKAKVERDFCNRRLSGGEDRGGDIHTTRV